MTLDDVGLLGLDGLGDAPARLRAAVAPHRSVIGWATVELERAEVEVAEDWPARHGLGVAHIDAAPGDQLLGASSRLVRFGDGPTSAARDVVLLEPSTEGRLAAALARFGEGGVALYLIGDGGAPARARRAGFVLSSEADGPLGPERLVVVGPRWGPFLLLVAE